MFKPIMSRGLLLLVGYMLSCGALLGQEQAGLRLGNYAGVNGLMLNPATAHSFTYNWDINVVGGGLFFENTFGYLERASLLGLAANRNGTVSPTEQLDPENYDPDADFHYDFFDDNQKKSFYANTFMTGPSGFYRKGEHSFGLLTNVRATTSGQRLPPSLGYYRFKDQVTEEAFRIAPFHVGGLAWAELGVHYGYKMDDGRTNRPAFGVNLKVIKPLEAAYLSNNEQISLTKAATLDTLFFQGVDAEFGLTNNVTYDPSTNSVDYERNRVRGLGLAVDLGVEHVTKQPNGRELKLGASMVDFGRVGIKNGQYHELKTNTDFDIPLEDFETVTTEEEALALLSAQVLENTEASLVSNQFSLWLPAGLSLQADVEVFDNFYVNAMTVRRLSFLKKGVQRSNVIAVTPRYSLSWIEASLPIVLYNDKDLRIGGALRIGPLVMGTDHLFSVFVPNQFTGSDFYVALRVYPFWKGDGKNGGGRGKVKCYSF